jgi:hypothetical protein
MSRWRKSRAYLGKPWGIKILAIKDTTLEAHKRRRYYRRRVFITPLPSRLIYLFPLSAALRPFSFLSALTATFVQRDKEKNEPRCGAG